MLDAINIERLGTAAVVIAVKKLAMTTGRGMAKAQGVPDFPIAILDHSFGAVAGEANLDPYVPGVADQVERILLHGPIGPER